MTRSLKPLERALSQRSKKGLGTAVLVLGNGLNIQAALEAGVDPADDWDPMLRGIATEMGISGEDFDRLPDSTPLRWDSLVEWKAVAADCTLDEADLSLKGRLAHALRAAEERTKSLPLYGRVLSAGFENIISLSIDRRLALHAGRETFVPNREGWKPSLFDRHSVVTQLDEEPARIWYPHGDSADPGCIRLGTLDHTRMLHDLEDRRSYLMKDWSENVLIGWRGPEGGNRVGIMRQQLRPPKRYYEISRSRFSSWYDLFFLAPLIIIGARLPMEEWPIWWMLHQRARNFVPFARSAAQKTFYLTAAGEAPRHLERQPCDIEVVEFSSYDKMWSFLLRPWNA